ncbi:MAG: hypothetical protein RLZZ241_2308 [Bacteroidota bacterium]|jgi:DNA-binding NarL/FixJ family response regulator
MPIRKTLVVEPSDTAYCGIRTLLKESFSLSSEQVSDSASALWMLRSSLKKSIPFDLLIADYERHHHEINTAKLIAEAKDLQPTLKVVVYSSEKRPFALREIAQNSSVNGLVLQNHSGANELIKAIRRVIDAKRYISPNVMEHIQEVQHIALDEIGLKIIQDLANGYSQREIASRFCKENIQPFSLSSIEKKINVLKDRFQARNNVHLISRANALGVL